MPQTDWFTDARFGMFIHWGLYSTPAGIWQGEKIKRHYSEWLQASEQLPRADYRALINGFNPTDFFADTWIRAARQAGMKYFIITAKHHDGFALWPSRASSYNVMDATPYGRDILGELAKACHEHGVKFGLYYSHWQDWDGTGGDIDVTMENDEYRHPTAEEFEWYWQNKCLAQVKELIETYDPDLMWFDSWGERKEGSVDPLSLYITDERQEELIGLIRSLSDKCLINSRIHFTNASDNVDYISTMDNSFPSEGFDKPWETSGTLNDSWAYHSLDFSWKSTQTLIKNLVSNAALGGNYQLNVGPTGDGCFQPAAIKRLAEIGAWLDTNGESVYGTTGNPLGKVPWGRITARMLEGKITRLYLHLWDVTLGDDLLLGLANAGVIAAKVLETGQPITCNAGQDGVSLTLPLELKGCDLPVIALDVRADSLA